MSLALVAVFSAFGYFMLSQGLDRIAKAALESKMSSFSHSLAASSDAQDVTARSHALIELAMGHSNLYVYIVRPDHLYSPLLTIGPQPMQFQPGIAPSTPELALQEWQDGPNRLMLTGAQTVQLKDGTSLTAYLTVDRTSDQELLNALLKWGLAAFPLILMVILVVVY
ncbi:hypothetical protein ACOAPY_18040 [Pseudomonas sp. P3C3]